MPHTTNEQESSGEDTKLLFTIRGSTWNLHIFADENDDVWFQLDGGVQVNVSFVRSFLIALEDEEFEEEFRGLLEKYNALPEQVTYMLEG